MVFVYMTVILSAIQTAMASNQSRTDALLQEVSYWFSVGLLLTVVGVLGLMLLVFLVNFVNNMFKTLTHDKNKRKEHRI